MGGSSTARLVPVAMCCEKPARNTSAGTKTIPPPTPKNPEAIPAATPISASRSQDGTRPSGLLLLDAVDGDGDRLRVRDVDEVALLDPIEVRGVAHLDRRVLAVGIGQRDRAGLLVDAADRGRDGRRL